MIVDDAEALEALRAYEAGKAFARNNPTATLVDAQAARDSYRDPFYCWSWWGGYKDHVAGKHLLTLRALCPIF